MLSLTRWKPVAGVLVGALFGFAWYSFVGCRTGTCPITARWWTSTAYGALMGLLFSRS